MGHTYRRQTTFRFVKSSSFHTAKRQLWKNQKWDHYPNVAYVTRGHNTNIYLSHYPQFSGISGSQPPFHLLYNKSKSRQIEPV